jgi:hypothetical protein
MNNVNTNVVKDSKCMLGVGSNFMESSDRVVAGVCLACAPLEACASNELALPLPFGGVPDSRKGERLVELHTLSDNRLVDLLKKLPQLGLPNLWVPRPNQFFHIDTIRHLATGKMDLRAIREMAGRFSAETATADKDLP